MSWLDAFIPKAENVQNPTVAVASPSNRKCVSVVRALTPWQANLVLEFIEVDGLTLDEAQAMAAISVQPRPAAEWLAMIAELDDLIRIYFAAAADLTGEGKAAILSTRCGQSLASIPETLASSRREVARIAGTTLAPAPEHALNFEAGPRAMDSRCRTQQKIFKGAKQ